MTAYEAVVFDLYGTLVPEFALVDWDAMFEAMAAELDLDPGALRRGWDETMVERQTGRLGSIEANIGEVCRRIGASPDEVAVGRALEIRALRYRDLFHPREGAVEILRWLRGRGTRRARQHVRARYPGAVARVAVRGPDRRPRVLQRGRTPQARRQDLPAGLR